MAADLHIYLPDDLYQEVKDSNLSVSQIAQQAFRRELAKKQSADSAIDANELEITMWTGEQTQYTATFMGTWLVAPDPDETRADAGDFDAGAYWGVALLENGDFLVYVAHVNDGWEPGYEVAGDLEDAELPPNIFVEAALAFNSLLRIGNGNAKRTREAAYEVRVPLDLD
jgi:hypothetical protein